MNPLELKKRLAGVINYGDMPEGLQVEEQQKLVYRVMKRLAGEIMKKVPENRLQELHMISEGGGEPKVMQDFLGEYIFNLEAFTDETINSEVEIFKQTYNYS